MRKMFSKIDKPLLFVSLAFFNVNNHPIKSNNAIGIINDK